MIATPWVRVPYRAVAVLTAMCFVTACGTQLSDERIEAGVGLRDAPGSPAGPVAVADLGTATDGQPAGAVAGPGSGPAADLSGTGSAATPGVNSPADGAGSAAEGNAAARRTRGSGAGSVAASAACTKSLAPVVIGQTLAVSGLVGASIGNLRTGLAVWAKAVNATGGLQCHPVQVVSLDDGSDPARASSNFNELVYNRNAVSIVGVGLPIAIAALRAAAEKAKVPVVGGDNVATDWNQSPYLFPQGGTSLSGFAGAIKEAADSKGVKKLGLVYCVEATICGSVNKNIKRMAQQAGVELVSTKAASLTQTDFTAECQTMKSAGAEVIFVVLDGSGVVRFARNCAALSYRPAIATSAMGISAALSLDPNLRENTLFLGTPVAPFTASDTAGGKEFQAALARFAPGLELDQPTMLGWSSGKLFEAAIGAVATEARSGPITTALVLKGLWSLQKETLDGLAPPMTFAKDKPAPSINCYYYLRLDRSGFSGPKAGQPTCLGEPVDGSVFSAESAAVARAVPPGVATVNRRRTARPRQAR